LQKSKVGLNRSAFLPSRQEESTMKYLKALFQKLQELIENAYCRYNALKLHDEAEKVVRRKTNPYQKR
jgi:hypothetical protein